MGIAVPSLAEASRRPPSSVKADPASADDVLVTSVDIAPPAIDEPVSPELALVDPALGERLRARLPEIELEPPPPVPILRALPDPEPEVDMPLAPPPELVDEPDAIAAAPVPAPVPVYVFPTRGDRLWSFAKAFALGAAAATVVTVGVVAELGDGPPTAQDPATAPPKVTASAPGAKVASGGGATSTAQPAATGRTGAGGTNAQRQASKGATAPQTTSRQAGGVKRQKTAPPAAATGETKRFAWAPVDGALGYRLALFRGDAQVLEARTKQPAYELASRWRHAGKTETLLPGSYRWYVWPVFKSGPAATAVVQAKLSVP
jgi:hypothetical protein